MTAAKPLRARVFNIPPGASFLPTFAASFLAGDVIPGFPGTEPLALASATIYVPTRRAARALAVEFSHLLPAPSAILPRIIPLGNLDGLESDYLLEERGLENSHLADVPEAASRIDRRLVLARLILAWARQVRAATARIDANGEVVDDPDAVPLIAASPGHAWRLAGDLGGLIDEMIIEGVDWRQLEKIVPDAFDKYWGITLDFLKIAIALWPEYLREHDLVDGTERRARLIEAEVARLSSLHASRPVVAIGSTGTNKATAHLLAAIARSPSGAVVLPGLDRELDENAWRLIAVGGSDKKFDGHDSGAGHPQAALRRLLGILRITREDVVDLAPPNPPIAMRMRFLQEALRPADSTEHWRIYASTLDASQLERALEGISLIEADDERDEALALAIAMREALEQPGATAACVTPDRQLAKRVRAELARWGIDVDDSGGEPLSATGEGTLASLVLDAAIDSSDPVATLSLLAHPSSLFSLPRAEVERLASLLEIGVLRAILPDEPDPAALVAAACRFAAGRDAHPAQSRIGSDQWEKITDLLVRLRQALQPLIALTAGAPLRAWIEAHRQALGSVKRGVDEIVASGEDSQTLEQLLDALAAGSAFDENFSAEDYRGFLDLALKDEVVRGPLRSHSRLKILGLLEARLLAADVMLLGGLDETIWPPQASTDAFLNRPMRAELGLTPPERRIGQTAHDFVMAMGNTKVIVSRARKRDGAPTVPSRFLQRIEALAGESAWRACRARGERFLSFARALDRPQTIAPAPRPTPRPAVALRPTHLSVTRIETLRRDPYAIYAERILKLRPLEELRGERGARESGIFLHALLAEFATALPTGGLPENASDELLARAQRTFADFLVNADFRAFQWPRIETGLTAFLDWERERRKEIDTIVAEADGRLTIPLSDGSIFTLTAKADRIERHVDGTIVIIDYKSGRLPSAKQVKVGFSPQLTLEAAMVERNGFEALPPPTKVAAALYVKVGGGETLEVRPVGDTKEPFGTLVERHFEGLVSLLEDFRKLSTPYLPRPFPQFVSSYSDYDHLARVKEWSTGFSEGASES